MKNYKKVMVSGFAALVMSILPASATLAHVVVTPSVVKTAARSTFAVSVPNEHETPVVSVRLVIPEGLESVRPFAKAGWDIDVKRVGEGEESSVTEITWKGGEIGVALKDEFQFGAKAPAEDTQLIWKAYETYADGTVVGWDQEPSEDEANKPYSVTEIVTKTEAEIALEDTQKAATDADKAADRGFYAAIAGVVVAFIALVLASKPKK